MLDEFQTPPGAAGFDNHQTGSTEPKAEETADASKVTNEIKSRLLQLPREKLVDIITELLKDGLANETPAAALTEQPTATPNPDTSPTAEDGVDSAQGMQPETESTDATPHPDASVEIKDPFAVTEPSTAPTAAVDSGSSGDQVEQMINTPNESPLPDMVSGVDAETTTDSPNLDDLEAWDRLNKEWKPRDERTEQYDTTDETRSTDVASGDDAENETQPAKKVGPERKYIKVFRSLRLPTNETFDLYGGVPNGIDENNTPEIDADIDDDEKDEEDEEEIDQPTSKEILSKYGGLRGKVRSLFTGLMPEADKKAAQKVIENREFQSRMRARTEFSRLDLDLDPSILTLAAEVISREQAAKLMAVIDFIQSNSFASTGDRAKELGIQVNNMLSKVGKIEPNQESKPFYAEAQRKLASANPNKLLDFLEVNAEPIIDKMAAHKVFEYFATEANKKTKENPTGEMDEQLFLVGHLESLLNQAESDRQIPIEAVAENQSPSEATAEAKTPSEAEVAAKTPSEVAAAAEAEVAAAAAAAEAEIVATAQATTLEAIYRFIPSLCSPETLTELGYTNLLPLESVGDSTTIEAQQAITNLLSSLEARRESMPPVVRNYLIGSVKRIREVAPLNYAGIQSADMDIDEN